jgi:hypothetical protein
MYHRWVGPTYGILVDSRNGRSRLYKSCDPRPILLLSLLLHLSVNMNFTSVFRRWGQRLRRKVSRLAQRDAGYCGKHRPPRDGFARQPSVNHTSHTCDTSEIPEVLYLEKEGKKELKEMVSSPTLSRKAEIRLRHNPCLFWNPVPPAPSGLI